ncbi:MAG: hypothetical protein AAFR61_23130 [Bacteroidota bacterium]
MVKKGAIVLSLFFFLFDSLSAQKRLASDFPGSRDGLAAMLQYIIQASPKERKALNESLKPDLEDCQAVFTPDVAQKIFRYQKKLNRTARIVIRPLMNKQTDYLLWGSNSHGLSVYEGEARYFPGGYKEISHYLQDNFVFYRVKFIEPGRKLGSAYDMLVYIDGNWRLIHRPWAALVEHKPLTLD